MGDGMEHLVVGPAVRAGAAILTLFTLGCGDGEPTVDACEGYTALASPSEIARTPRDDFSAEVLTIEAYETFLAGDARYERIAAELDAIGKLEPATRYIRPLSLAWTDMLLVRLTDSSDAAMRETLDCPNRAYGGKIVDVVSQTVHVDFGGRRFNSELLSQAYESLANVENAHGETWLGDGADVCIEVQGDEHFYIFDEASGDCPAGCINHFYYGFSASPNSAVASIGTYDTQQPEPAWYSKLLECRQAL